MMARALRDLASGRPILLYDLDGREQETDMIVAGELITPDHIAALRTEAGGLICAAISSRIATKLGLPYLRDLYQSSNWTALKAISSSQAPYGGYPAFSVSVNHRDTYTGITDLERHRTIRELASLVAEASGNAAKDWPRILAERFRSPGHVHILIGSELDKRQGHTELSLQLAEMAGLQPVMAICEMLDAQTHRALAKVKAAEYARRHGLALVEAREILNAAEVRA